MGCPLPTFFHAGEASASPPLRSVAGSRIKSAKFTPWAFSCTMTSSPHTGSGCPQELPAPSGLPGRHSNSPSCCCTCLAADPQVPGASLSERLQLDETPPHPEFWDYLTPGRLLLWAGSRLYFLWDLSSSGFSPMFTHFVIQFETWLAAPSGFGMSSKNSGCMLSNLPYTAFLCTQFELCRLSLLPHRLAFWLPHGRT